jgi:hypothetical protein
MRFTSVYVLFVILLGGLSQTPAEVIISVGYLNNLSGPPTGPDVPIPFDPDSTTVLISSGVATMPHDTSVIRFENRSSMPVMIDRGLRVTTEIRDSQTPPPFSDMG